MKKARTRPPPVPHPHGDAGVALLRWSRTASSLRAYSSTAVSLRLFLTLCRLATAAHCEASSKVLLKGMDYPKLEVRALDLWPL
jgi:hypothetical protein